jgi:hypothetical protein
MCYKKYLKGSADNTLADDLSPERSYDRILLAHHANKCERTR